MGKVYQVGRRELLSPEKTGNKQGLEGETSITRSFLGLDGRPCRIF